MNAIVPYGNTALTPTSMESALQLAEMMARGKLVPSHLQNSPGDCLMVIEAAMRWKMSPFAVAQCTSVIQGKLMFEGKLVAAALHTSGILSSRLDYEFSGEKEQRAVTVRATLIGETKPRDVTVFLADAKTANSMWTKQPDQQLVYASSRVWARRHAPEVMLGVYAPEEFDQAMPFNGTTLEGETEAPPPRQPDARDRLNAEIPLRAAAAPMPRGASVRAPVESTPDEAPAWLAPLEETDPHRWEIALDLVLANCQSRAEVVQVGGHHSVETAIAKAPNGVKMRVSKKLADAFGRFAADPEPPDELGEIVGEARMGAG